MKKQIKLKGLVVLVSEAEQFNFEAKFPSQYLSDIDDSFQMPISILIANHQSDLSKVPHHRCAVVVHMIEANTVRIEVVDIAITTFDILKPYEEVNDD